MTPKIVAVVVTYNRLAHLQAAIAALLPQQCDAIVVIDNYSTDGTREWLLAQSNSNPRIDVVLAPRNLGGAGGFELGFKRVLNVHKPEWLVCFDDDARPTPEAFQSFFTSDLMNVDAAAAAVFLPSGSICEMNRPAINPFWNWQLFFKTVFGQGRRGFHLSDKDYQASRGIPIDTASFVGFFIRCSMVRKVGLPKGKLFIYGDDVLYTLTIRRAGGRIIFLPWVTFIHDCAALSTHENVISPLWKVYYAYRNSLHVYHAAAGALFWLIIPFKITKWFLNTFAYKDKKRAYLQLTFTAIKDAVSKRYNRSHEEILSLAEK